MKHQKMLFNYVDSLIRDNKKVTRESYTLQVSDLADYIQEEFAATLIEHDSFENEGWNFLMDDLCREELAANFAEFLTSYGHKKDALRFAFLDGLKTSANKYYQVRMQSLIDERIEQVQSEDIWEENSSAYHDQQSQGMYL